MPANLPLTLTTAAAALASGEISSVELTQAVIARTRAVEARLGAFNSHDEDAALAQARASDARRAAGKSLGPLDGIPVGLKDNIAARNQPLTASSKMLAGYISPFDATVTRRLRDAGAVFWGRLNLDEFAMGSSTENSATRPTANPYNLDCVAGGSSGGCAAAVAAGEVVAALGTDTGGSIRQPAAFCNLAGLRPTHGLVSRSGIVAHASSLDQAGPIARTVEDAAILLSAIAGHDPLDSATNPAAPPDYHAALTAPATPCRLGVPREYFGGAIDPEIAAAVRAVIDFYEKQGCEIREISLPHTDCAVSAYHIIASAECSSNLARYDGVRYGRRSPRATNAVDIYTKSRAEGFGAEVKRRILLGTHVLTTGCYDAWFVRAQKIRALIRRDFTDALKEVDAIITPATPAPAFRKGTPATPLEASLRDACTAGASLAGLPALSMPCGFTQGGLPIGAQLIGRPFGEAALLALANVHDTARDWNTRLPSL